MKRILVARKGWKFSAAKQLGACFLAVIIVLAQLPSKAASRGAPSNGRITYSSRKQIFTMTANGSRVRRITDTEKHNRTPTWSPDGRLIAYGCRGDRSSERDICIARADGSRGRNVTKDSILDRDPDWAPGGMRLVFARRAGMVYQLFVMMRNGENLHQITTTATEARDPEWSPDGSRILFTAVGPFGGPDIYSIRPNGEDQVNLTLSPEFEGSASWSPDGKTIVYSRDDQLMLMASDGADPKPMAIRGNNPKWAPNERRIVAHRLRESQYQRCFSIRLDGTKIRWLSARFKQCYSPDWAPRR